MSSEDNNKIFTPNTHLIFTSILTNRRISDRSFDYNRKDFKCVNQFLTSIHSMADLGIESQSFHLELDDIFLPTQGLIKEKILEYFPKAKIFWKRLEYFEDWNLSMRQIPVNSDIILLQSNFDHAYIAKDAKLFTEFANQVKLAGSRAVGEITHWPEALSEISWPWVKDKKLIIDEKCFKTTTKSAVGTTLFSRNLYEEIWSSDFTRGSRITRPDNPFGPSVEFELAQYLLPKHELFRHLDGYLHVGIKSQWVKQLSPCCVISNGSIKHSEWIYGVSKDLKKRFWEYDLPDDTELYKELPVNKLLKSISHRINFKVMQNLTSKKSKYKFGEFLAIIMFLSKFSEFWRKIPRQIMDLTFGPVLIYLFLQEGTTIRDNYLLSRVVSKGWRSLFKIDFFKTLMYKVVKKIEFSNSKKYRLLHSIYFKHRKL